MKTYLNTDTGLLTLAPGATTGIAKISAKRGDLFLLEVVPSGTITGATGVFAAKSTYSGDPVALASSWDAPETESTGYLFTIDLNTTDLNALFTSEIADVTLLAEITWSLAGAIRSTQTLSLVVARDVWRGDEADPTAASDFKATQAEAEAGTDNAKWMSPLRTAQGIAAWVSGHASAVCSAINATVAPAWANVSGKPTIIPDAAGSIAEDGKQYARQDGAWAEVAAGGSTAPEVIASTSSVKFGAAAGTGITKVLPATPAAGDKAKYYITLTGSSKTFDRDAAILLPSDSGLTLPKTFTSTKTYIVLFEFNGTSWMLVSLVGGY